MLVPCASMRPHYQQQISRIRGSNFSAASVHSNPRQTSLLNTKTITNRTMVFQFSVPTFNLPPSSRSGLLHSSSGSRIHPPLGSRTRPSALPCQFLHILMSHTDLASLPDLAGLTRCDGCLAVCVPQIPQGLQLAMHPLGCHPLPCLSFQAVAQLELLLQSPPFDGVLARESKPALLLECRK